MIRLNITMPEEVVQRLEKVKNKSRYITEAVKEKMRHEDMQQMKEGLIEGYKAMNTAEYRKELEDWDAISAEGWD